MPWCGACCELNRCKPVKARVRSVGVVVDPPFFDDLACLLDVGEQVLVEALVTQSAVEALHEPILHRFAGRNVVPFDITLLLPGQDGVRGQLGAVVADDHSGVARSSAIRSSSRATRRPVSEVSTTRVRHSRVKSSTSVRMRKRRPLTSVSATKSSDQRKLRSWGTAIGARVPRARLRLPRLRTISLSSL